MISFLSFVEQYFQNISIKQSVVQYVMMKLQLFQWKTIKFNNQMFFNTHGTMVIWISDTTLKSLQVTVTLLLQYLYNLFKTRIFLTKLIHVLILFYFFYFLHFFNKNFNTHAFMFNCNPFNVNQLNIIKPTVKWFHWSKRSFKGQAFLWGWSNYWVDDFKLIMVHDWKANHDSWWKEKIWNYCWLTEVLCNNSVF